MLLNFDSAQVLMTVVAHNRFLLYVTSMFCNNLHMFPKNSSMFSDLSKRAISNLFIICLEEEVENYLSNWLRKPML